jgi:hypothetical protein
MKKVVGDEGVFALWKGVNAAWLREASYTSLRLGLYEPVKIAFGANDPATSTFMKKFLAGSAAGAIGSLAGNPFDVLKTKVSACDDAISARALMFCLQQPHGGARKSGASADDGELGNRTTVHDQDGLRALGEAGNERLLPRH